MKIEISKKALKSNIQIFRNLILKKVKLAAVVKSNAYGHGILEISKLALEFGADYLAVNSIEEAILLRKNFPNTILIIMGEILNMEFFKKELNDENFWIVVSRFESVKFLNSLDKSPKIHLKVDTGMGRLGYYKTDFYKNLDKIKKENLKLHGILTHFAQTEDYTEHSYSNIQLEEFKKAIEYAEKIGYKNLVKHASASASTMLFKEAHFDLVRIGISLYGLWPSIQTKLSLSLDGKKINKLQPVLSWKTNIVHIQNLQPNSYIGYGSTYKTTSNTILGVIPVGYNEGFDRRLSNLGYVLVNGERAKILGRICMNMSMIDITSIKNVQIGNEVVLIGKSGHEEILADGLAEMTGTINYQIVTNINPSIPRIIL